MASKLSSFLAELKRRKVYHVAVVYVLVGLAVAQGADWAFDLLELPNVASQLVAVVLILGFPIALVLAWAYEVRPEEPRPVESALIAGAETPKTEERKSIVVLPFDNMSPDPGDAYFSDGLTEEIITNLSHLRSLRVISRSSAMVVKGVQKDVRTIGRELGVQFVLEGSVRKVGHDLRMTAQLIDAGTDEHLWAETYDGTLEDVFRIQEETARSIVDALRLSLTPEEDQGLAERPIEDVEAYQLYLMGRRDFGAGTPDGLERARRHFENALEMIGENVTLLQGLAEVHTHVYLYGVKPDEESVRQAEELANRISALDPDSAASHYMRGKIVILRGSFTKAVGHFERALAFDPNHFGSLLYLFYTYSLQTGRASYAVPLRTQVLAQDPLDFLTWWMIGVHDWMRGDLEEAFSNFRKAGAFVGGSDFADLFMAYLLVWMDRRDEALSLIREVVHRETPVGVTDLARLLEIALEGKGVSAREALGPNTRRWAWNNPELPWVVASSFALSGEKEEALDWLERAVERGWINYPLLSRDDPMLESIRGEERFRALMVGVKRDWQAFGAESKKTSLTPPPYNA